jgi:Tol biopolymer transport system component
MKFIHTTSALALVFTLGLAGCANEDVKAPAEVKTPTVAAETTDYSLVKKASVNEGELPIWLIPNMPESAEAYYGPDSYHIIAQTQDPDAVPPSHARAAGGALTWIVTDDGKHKWRANDHGQDACSYIMPDGKRIVYTSTRDNMDMPVGNWSDETEYPQGAELYMANMDGSDVQRLTNNEFYDAEVSVSPDGSKIVFTRQIDGKLDIWMMNSDGTNEHQITHTDIWQEGAPFFLPDNKTLTMRAWKRKKKDPDAGHEMTLMTVFTVDTDTGEATPITTDAWMNWAPYPTPDGKHYVFVRPLKDNPMNWEVFLGSIDGSAPVRLTYNDSFDGFPSVSPDGTKMLFTRSVGKGFMSDLYTYAMDISSLNVGPDNG